MTTTIRMMRPSWDDLWMNIAWQVSGRSTCNRRMVGAVIVAPDNRIISTGYNGSPTGQGHCTSWGCLEDDQGRCKRSVHAETNAILAAARHGSRIEGATLYTTSQPCENCTLMILNSGIARVVYDDQDQWHPVDSAKGTQGMSEIAHVIVNRDGSVTITGEVRVTDESGEEFIVHTTAEIDMDQADQMAMAIIAKTRPWLGRAVKMEENPW